MRKDKITRTLLFYLVTILAACGRNPTSHKSTDTGPFTKTKDSLPSSSNTGKIQRVKRSCFIGDINNDNLNDTAFVVYHRIVRVDGTIEKDCATKNCEITISFNNGIPDLVIEQSLSIYIQQTDDLNGDKAGEILLFSEWFEGWWYNMYVWTFKNGRWKEMARTKAMLSEDKYYEDRIIRSGGAYYLVGDSWDDNKGGVTERSVKVKIVE